MSIWARPLLVGLLVLGLLASAGITIAAPSRGSAAPVTPIAPVLAVKAPTLVVSPALPPAEDLTPRTTRSPVTAPALAPATRPPVAAQAKTVTATSKPKTVTTKPKTVPKPSTTTYSGVYHLWIPALGLSHRIYDWGCNGGLIPDRVEYWGCVGRNNLYLLGHAYGVFRSVHDGYHSGALRVGLTAWYADRAAKIHRYVISQIRHVANKDYATWSRWAMAATSGPVITLQTCDGSTSAYRILVRLVPA